MADVGVDRSMRGAAAVVGVADAVSPTGQLELRGRALEAAMVKEALDDAGLTLVDIDGVWLANTTMIKPLAANDSAPRGAGGPQ